MPFTFTGHSLGAQKLEKLGTTIANWSNMEARYLFSRRVAAERMSMAHAARIIVSTGQEQKEQYSKLLPYDSHGVIKTLYLLKYFHYPLDY